MPSHGRRSDQQLRPPSLAIQLWLLAGYCLLIAVVWLFLQMLAPGWPLHYLRLWMVPVSLLYWFPLSWFLRTKRGIDLRSRRPHATNGRASAAVARWLFGYIGVVVAAFALLIAILFVRPAWTAAHGGGTTGTLTFAYSKCHGSNCDWYGTFEADDGSIGYSEVQYDDSVPPIEAQVGTSIRARLVDTDAYRETGSTAWHTPATVAIVAGTYLVGGLAWLAFYIRRRRRAVAGGHDPLNLFELPT